MSKTRKITDEQKERFNQIVKENRDKREKGIKKREEILDKINSCTQKIKKLEREITRLKSKRTILEYKASKLPKLYHEMFQL